MAIVTIKPGRTEVQLTARARGSEVPPSLRAVPGGLYPLMSASYEVDEYRIMAGWPTPVPEIDIRIGCLVSAAGDKLGNREAPTSVTTNADMRWIADTDHYDQISGQWAPIQGGVSPWTAGPANMPTLRTDYEYRNGNERFTGMTVLNFDSNTADYLVNDLNLAMGGMSGYTVILVMSPNSIYGNDDTVESNMLWGPETTDGAWSAFTVRDRAVYLTTESMKAQKGVAIGNALDSAAPCYLAMVVGRPQTTLYAATGPSEVLMKGLAAGATREPLSARFRLGSGPLAKSATMDMALFDVGIYGRLLTKAQVSYEFAQLSTIYGG